MDSNQVWGAKRCMAQRSVTGCSGASTLCQHVCAYCAWHVFGVAVDYLAVPGLCVHTISQHFPNIPHIRYLSALLPVVCTLVPALNARLRLCLHAHHERVRTARELQLALDYCTLCAPDAIATATAINCDHLLRASAEWGSCIFCSWYS